MEYIEEVVAETLRWRIVRRIEELDPDQPDNASMLYTLRCVNTGRVTEVRYTGQEAWDLIVWANTADFSVKSQQRRALEKFVADGKLEGTIGGVVEV